MAEHPLQPLDNLDPELRKLVGDNRQFALLSDGALPRKIKLLIAMALDAALGSERGVNALTQQAMQAGATKEEIAETLRVVHYISGARGVHTAAHGLKDVF